MSNRIENNSETNNKAMEQDKEKWIEEVFDSLKGGSRAVPKAQLFEQIEEEIFSTETIALSTFQWKIGVAAAVLFIGINVFTLRSVIGQINSGPDNLTQDNNTEYQIMSDYKIY